jgi:hypothetical protein
MKSPRRRYYYNCHNYTITQKLLTSTIVCNMQSTSTNQDDVANESIDIHNEVEEMDGAGEKVNSDALKCRVSKKNVLL